MPAKDRPPVARLEPASGELRVVLGMPVFEAGASLQDALRGLLRQTYDAYRLVLVDDASGDAATRAILEGAARDPRVTVRRNRRRLGLSGNWQATLEAARELHPGAELFAWAGHHDLWDEEWLATMVARLDANPRAVLAYPLDARLDAAGLPRGAGTRPFSTVGETDPRRRVVAYAREGCAGSAIYGLVRMASLERAGGFERVLRPDRLVLAKLAVLGEFDQVPRVLWWRRETGAPTVRRQRAAIFPDGDRVAPRLPWPVAHVRILARWTMGRAPAASSLGAASIVASYVGPMLARDALQWVLERGLRVEARLPHRVGASARRLLGRPPRRA